MTKRIKYFICIMMLFFTFGIEDVYGEERIDPIVLGVGDIYTILTDEYTAFSCEFGEDNKYLSLTVTANSHTISYDKDEAEEGTVVKMSCNWEKDTRRGIFDYYFELYYEARGILNITLVYGKDAAWDILNFGWGDTDYPIYMIPNLKYIKNIEPNVNESNNAFEYLDLTCDYGAQKGSGECIIEVNQKYEDDKMYESEELTAYYKVKYVDIYDIERNDTFRIYIRSAQYLTVSGLLGNSTCTLDEPWTRIGDSSKWHTPKIVGESVTLPDCSSDYSETLPTLRFYGWIDLSQFNDGENNGINVAVPPNVYASDWCKEYVKNPTNTFDVQKNSSGFLACYENRGLALHLNGGKIENHDEAVVVNDAAYFDVEGEFILPNIVEVPSFESFYGEGEFLGWRRRDGEDDGYFCNPQTETCVVHVNPGDSYEAVYNSGVGIASGPTVFIDLSRVGQESQVVPLRNNVKNCYVYDESETYFSVEVSGGECIVSGKSSTEGKYIDLVLIDENDTMYISKVRITDTKGNFQYIEDVFVLLDNNADFSTTGGTGSLVTSSNGVTLCDRYLVTSSGISTGAIARYKGSFDIRFTEYRATSKCDSSIVHLALCMDPGRPGPGSGTIYLVDDSFGTDSDEIFPKVLNYIVKRFVEKDIDKNDKTTANKMQIASANAALRLAQYFEQTELASEDLNITTNYFKNAIAAYKAAGGALYESCLGNLPCDPNVIESALRSAWAWNDENVLATVVDYLSNYDDSDSVVKLDVVKNELDEDLEPGKFEGETLKFHFSGDFVNFPVGTDLNTIKLEANCDHLCSNSTCCTLNKGVPTDGKIPYDFDIVLNKNEMLNISTMDESRKPAIFISTTIEDDDTFKTANVFVLKPENGNHQRMAIFNLEGAKMKFTFDLNLTCDTSIPILDHNSEAFNPVIFREVAGCCNLVDVESDEYKYYCDQFCYANNLQTYCHKTQVGEGSDGNGGWIDTYSLKEGYIENNKSFYCIVDISKDEGISATKKKFDSSGNQFVNKSNGWCAISCREEWDISMPGFNNFLGEKAVIAGTGFIMSNEMYFRTKRSCYSTFIDYIGFNETQQSLAEAVVNAYSEHSEYTKVYSVLKASQTTEDIEYIPYYKVVGDPYNCGHTWHGYYGDDVPCPTDEDPDKMCPNWISTPCGCDCHTWVAVEDECTIYKMSTSAGGNYDKSDYKEQSNSGTGNKLENATQVAGTGSISSSALSIGGAAKAVGGSVIQSIVRDAKKPDPEVGSFPEEYKGVCCGTGTDEYNCTGGPADFEYLLSNVKYNSKSLMSNIVSQKEIVDTNIALINSNAEAMSQCQNFYLINDSIKNPWNAGDTTISSYGGEVLFPGSSILTDSGGGFDIVSKFEPEASYVYEESQFMAELGKEKNITKNGYETYNSNIIIPYEEKNGDVPFGECGNSINRKNAFGEELKICRGSTEVSLYYPASGDLEWTNDASSSEAQSYHGVGFAGHDVSTLYQAFDIPLCQVNDGYDYVAAGSEKKCEDTKNSIYEFNYITRSLENSSYYRNRGSWFSDKTNDVKGHGDDKVKAIENNEVNNPGGGMDPETTDFFLADDVNDNGLGGINVFPVALDTPRNIYQYEYAFKAIGIYPNGGTGRILGNTNSLIKNNVRRCYYEVREELCKCCGDPIVIYSYDTSRVSDTVDKIKDDYDFVPSKDNYSVRNPYFSPKTSPVSLYDLDGVTNRELASNWSSNDVYIYNGVEYTTSKGSELVAHLNAKGEEIYNKVTYSPEYSYILTPSALSAIRSYNANGANVYGIPNDENKVIINKVCFAGGISSACDSSDKNGYYHYSTTFVTEFLNNYKNPDFTSIIDKSTDSTCYVQNGSALAGKINSCRWVDYKTSDGHYLAYK